MSIVQIMNEEAVLVWRMWELSWQYVEQDFQLVGQDTSRSGSLTNKNNFCSGFKLLYIRLVRFWNTLDVFEKLKKGQKTDSKENLIFKAYLQLLLARLASIRHLLFLVRYYNAASLYYLLRSGALCPFHEKATCSILISGSFSYASMVYVFWFVPIFSHEIRLYFH